jgi:cytochrome c551/c552
MWARTRAVGVALIAAGAVMVGTVAGAAWAADRGGDAGVASTASDRRDGLRGAPTAPDSRYGLGRAPTPAEIAAWDIDVRPDFTGLPKGSGSVERGQEIWESKCASCHGVFGESNDVFNPIIGGTTVADVKSGRVASLTTSELQRTTMMKLSSLATLWDYIRRAMPWTAPKSLTTDDVYASTAYILHLADLVPAGFVLSDANIRETEKLLPNRNGMTRSHGMWDLRGKPDVRNVACMKDCGEAVVQSAIPGHARNAHGNLALQNRTFGGVVGVDTTRPALAAAAGASPPPRFAAASSSSASSAASSPSPRPASPLASPAPAAPAASHPMLAVATRHGCMACHAVDRKLVGPSFRDVASKYRSSVSTQVLAKKMRDGGSGAWGPIPMPPQTQLPAADAEALAAWILGGDSR